MPTTTRTPSLGSANRRSIEKDVASIKAHYPISKDNRDGRLVRSVVPN